MRPEEFEEPRWARFLFASTTAAWLWLVVRLYIASVFLPAGWGKVTSGEWLFGAGAGTGPDRGVTPWTHAASCATPPGPDQHAPPAPAATAAQPRSGAIRTC